MGWPIRLEYPGAVYHIYARGNRREHILLEDDDWELFLKIFADTANRLNWICHAYCLMESNGVKAGICKFLTSSIVVLLNSTPDPQSPER